MKPTDYAIKDVLNIEKERIQADKDRLEVVAAKERSRAAYKKKLTERRRCKTKYIQLVQPHTKNITYITQSTNAPTLKIKKQMIALWAISFIVLITVQLMFNVDMVKSKTIVITDSFEEQIKLSFIEHGMPKEKIVKKTVVKKKNRKKKRKNRKFAEMQEIQNLPTNLLDDPLGHFAL